MNFKYFCELENCQLCKDIPRWKCNDCDRTLCAVHGIEHRHSCGHTNTECYRKEFNQDEFEKTIIDSLREGLGMFDIGYSPILGLHFKEDAENHFTFPKRFDKKVKN